MLKQRVITALVLLAVFLPALFAPVAAPFLALTLALIAAAAWEWARLNGLAGAPALATGLLCAALCAGLWLGGAVARPLPALWLGVGALWIAGGAWLLRRGVAGWPRVPLIARWCAGLAVLTAAWLAMAQAHGMGVNFLLSVLALVWTADIGAYFAGRALGGRLTHGAKLARNISPGKSWEGVWGGMVGVLLLATGWAWLDDAARPSLFARLHQAGPLWLALGALLLAGMSVVGDLAESLVKRSAGMKDSSGLLPGHGGVLDRIDALLPTLPLALALAGLMD